MVTHNPELAEKYATRTVRILDGEITDDSNPYKALLNRKKLIFSINYILHFC